MSTDPVGIRLAAARLLGADPMPHDELLDALRAAGLDLGRDADDAYGAVFRAIGADPRFCDRADGSWVLLRAVLEATTWSTRIPAVPPADGIVLTVPDLTLVDWLPILGRVPIVGASESTAILGELEACERGEGEHGLVGPPGWLEPYAGGVLLVTVTDAGVVLARAETVPAPTARQAAAILAAYEQLVTVDTLTGDLVDVESADLEEVLLEAVIIDRGAFVDGPIAPVDELLATGGLERRDDVVAPAGTDWELYDRMTWRRRLQSLHDLDNDDVEALELLLLLSTSSVDGDAPLAGLEDTDHRITTFATMCLADEVLATAFLGEHQARGTPPESLAAFARHLVHVVDEHLVPGGRWLLAWCLDRLGDGLGAERELELAVAADTGFPTARYALAKFRSDRGDAAGAWALVRDLDLEDDDPLLDEFGPFALQRAQPTAGRNDPCPCGSGRKYKVCHLGRERLPLIERAPWLYRKARRYLHDNRFRMLGADLALTASRQSNRDLLLELLDSELVDDLALCEGGVFAHFLAERDALLPDDEALLAASWLQVPRSLFELERVDHDLLALRDLRTGERLEVTNITPSSSTRPGMLMVGRPLPVGDTWRAYPGFVQVPDVLRDDMLAALDDGDAFAIAEVTGAAFRPPELRNTDGDELVVHELRYKLADAAGAAQVLAASSLHDAGDGGFTLVRDSANQRHTVIATFELAGDELLVGVNSDERADEARGLVAELLPDAELIDHGRRTLDDVDPGAVPRLAPPDDPAIAAAIEEHIRQRELQWLDESIPLFEGMTPREAAADPVMRVELDRLLRRFDGVGTETGGFDAARLRTMLDL